jgi:hypothetical protein
MASTTAEFPPLQITLGPGATDTLAAGVPVLGGPAVEQLFPNAQPAGRQGPLALFRAGPWLVGGATLPLTTGLEAATHQIYTAIFAATKGLHLARVWHYVPAINETGPGDLENYRLFCRARSLAFEQHYGKGFKQLLPAASAVGAKSSELTIVFAASAALPQHEENRLQVSAYDYPADYGPRSPSFARATIVRQEESRTVFISGTAAIRGHATMAPNVLGPQLTCTLENLREISRACGLGSELERSTRTARHFKVYLRHAADQPEVETFLRHHLVTPADQVWYLHADICRSALLVEIEATLIR